MLFVAVTVSGTFAPHGNRFQGASKMGDCWLWLRKINRYLTKVSKELPTLPFFHVEMGASTLLSVCLIWHSGNNSMLANPYKRKVMSSEIELMCHLFLERSSKDMRNWSLSICSLVTITSTEQLHIHNVILQRILRQKLFAIRMEPCT